MTIPVLSETSGVRATGMKHPTPAGPGGVWRGWLGVLACAVAVVSSVTVAGAAGDPELISVDFVLGPTTGDGTGPCSGDTVLTGTTMNNAVGNIFTGQAGAWNSMNIGTYNQTSATSGFLTNGAGTVTTAKMVMGVATGLNSTLAGGWRCSPNEGTANTIYQLRNETAYLYNGVITGDHYAWGFTGLIPNALYKMTFFGGSGNATGASNIVNSVAGIRDSEGDWNWDSITADSSGTITGTFTAPNPTLGLFGVQLKHMPRTVPPQYAPGTPVPADTATSVTTSPTFDWSDCPGAESYDVYLWPTSGSQPATPTASVAVSNYTPSGFLVPATNFSWQVVARNAAGTNAGPIWTFTTDDGRPAAAGTPTPGIAATGVLVDSVLSWGASPGATGYQIFIWLASGSKPATPTATLTAISYLPTQALAGNSLYNWQIVTINPYGSTNGPVWTFTTGDRYPGYLVPWPKSVTMGTGDFAITSSTRIVAEDASLLPLAQVMAKDMFMATGLTLTALQGTAAAGDIALRVNPSLTGEAYTLVVDGSNIALSGGTYQAAAWASVTLLQALDTSGTPVKVAQMSIADQPAAPLRTVMWDIARFFHPLETLYELVDLHRMYKVTYMHLYMSADGLFTFGSTAFPALAKTKNGSEAYAGSPGFYLPANGSRLYYTKAELISLVAYAKDRGVVIVPEIDTPSWAAYMTSALPATFCSSGGTTPTHDVNINYPTAVAAMDTLIGELAAVFSTAPYIHIGADEVSTDFSTYPNWATSKVTNNYANTGEAMVWYMHHLDATIKTYGKSSWAWSAPGTVSKGYDMPTDFTSATNKGLVYTGWGYDDGQGASASGYSVMRAAGGHVAGMGQANNSPPYNRCILYRPAQGIYNRLTPLYRFISAPDNMYTDLTPTFLPLTGTENKIVGAHIMEWESPYEGEVPGMRLSMPALGEPTWNQETSTRRNWDNFLIRQTRTDQLYQRVARPVTLSVTTQVDPKDVCFAAGGMVTMTSPVAGTIRYTVGTDYKNSWYNFPTSSSTAYTAPFAITQSSVISARLFDASGNPLGNPVTRGFYLITPKVHYKYFYTDTVPAANFESGTPIVSSVMGQMDGNAPQEDMRYGDTLHRTVYTGSLTITTAGAYTFSAAYGGTIAIDRAAVADGTAVTLAAGEHIFKIVTPASSTGTPYTFSGPGYSAGSDLNVLLKTLATASQVFPASYTFGSQSLSNGATASKEITIVNNSLTTAMTLTSVALTGTNSDQFVISADSGETVLAPGAQRIVAVLYNPTTLGSKAASLHVVAAGLTGGYADVGLSGTAIAGSLPAIPSTPVPASGASGVAVNPTLDWADAVGATGYDVYFWQATGTKPTTPTASVSVSQWTPSSSLTSGANYNWQVVATNTNGSTAGPQWTFHVGTSTVQVANLTDGQVMRYSMVLVDGTFDGGSTLTITAAPSDAAVSFTKYSNRFRCLVDLRPGTNTLTITDSHGAVTLNLVFTPPTATSYRFKVWYVVPSDEANSPVDPDWAAHFSLQTKLMQSWMAEDQNRAGNGRETFYPLLNAASNVDVSLLVVTQTRAQATALGTGMYSEVYNQIPSAYKDGVHKNLAFSSVAFNALGSGDLCYVGAYGATGSAYAGFHPADATQMMTKLLSTQLGNDGSLSYSTYLGVTLHETCHCIHNIWHDTSPNNIMGGGGYDISEYFTLTYSASNPNPHNETGAGTLGGQRDVAAWNRYLMSADPQTYNNTTIAVTAGPEYLTATSTYPLAVFQYYIPETSADLHAKLASSNVTTYSKHAGQARLELGANPYNVMAVDTQGNMSYTTFSATKVPVIAVADSFAVSPGSPTIAAPGVLANDINPSASTLTAAVATTTQHGTLALNSNGGFTYTPTNNYVGADTFAYRVSDGISSDQQALVTLTVSGTQVTPPVNPYPASGASAVETNTALDWGDVAAATSYDVYLWVTSQSKPATPTATVTASSYVPPSNLVGSTAYSWQVVASNANGSSAGAVWTFTTAAVVSVPGDLISVDFVYNGLGGSNGGVSAACSGDTTPTGTTMKNAGGNVFTGQTGAWNALIVGGNNADNSSATTGFLTNGSGTATTVKFAMGTATGLATIPAGGWRDDFQSGLAGGGGATLRAETAYLYCPTLTADHYAWTFTGLTPNAHYQLTLFGNGGSSFTNTANSVAAVKDSEGDWNWSDIAADSSGTILGTLVTTGTDETCGLYGAQIYKLPTSAALTANAGTDQAGASVTIGGTPVASGGTAPYTYSWAPSTGLSSATVANPTASPASTTIYTVTVTDFQGVTVTDAVAVTVGGSTATAVTSSPVTTGPYGTAVAFTATVVPAAPGSVVFKDGSTTLGTVTLVSGQATFTTSATALALGSHSITAYYGGSGSFTASTSAAYGYTVTAMPLTITGVTAANKVYDGNATAALTGGAVSGVISGETVTVVPGTGAFASANVGTQAVTASAYALGGSNAGNYVLSAQPVVANATISARPLQLSGTRTYDGSTVAAAGILAVSNNLDGAGLSLSGSANLAAKDAGSRAISTVATPTRVTTATGAVGSSAATSFTVALTAPAAGNTLIAIIATRSSSASAVTGIANSNGAGLTWTRAVQTAPSTTTTTEIWYAPVVAGAGTTVTINLSASLYAAAVIGEYSGLFSSSPMDVTANTSNSSSNTSPSTGTTATTTQANELWIGGIGLSRATYSLSAVTNSFASPNNAASGGGNSGARAYLLDRFVTATGTANSGGTTTSSRWSGAVATFKTVTPTTLALAGTAAGNYTLTGMTGAVTVTPKALALTGTGAVTSKTYDGLTAATLTGLTLPGSEAVGSGTTADGKPYSVDTVGLALSGVFTARDAGTGKTVSSTSVLTGAQAGNYSFTQPTGLTGTVTPKALTLTVATTVTSKNYDGLVAATLSGGALQAAETAGSGTTSDGKPYSVDTVGLTLSGTFNTKDAGGGKAVTSTSVLTGSATGNYSLTQPTGLTGTISPAALTVTANNQGKTYGQTVTFGSGATLFTSVGLQNSEMIGSVTLACSGGSAAASVGGSPYTITPSAATGGTFAAGNYSISYVPGSLTVSPLGQTITFGALADRTYGGTSFDLSATADSGLTVSYGSSDPTVASVAGNTVTILKAGVTTITASQAGDANRNAAVPVTQPLTVNKADQTITFGALAAAIVGDPPFAFNATASSGLTVSYVSSEPTVAGVSGNLVTILTAGTTTITAGQAGDDNRNAAVPVAQSLTVNPLAAGFAAWATDPALGLTAGVNDGPLDDPDHDGISNLLEFVLGGSPMVSSQAILPRLTVASGAWVFEYDRSIAAKSCTFQTVEYGDDLTGWTPVPVPETGGGGVTITPGDTSDHVRVSIPTPGPARYVRLAVSQ